MQVHMNGICMTYKYIQMAYGHTSDIRMAYDYDVIEDALVYLNA